MRRAFDGQRPDALMLFASARYDHEALLRALSETCQPHVLVGASSAGEFTGRARGEGSVCALAIRSSAMRFAAGVGRGVGADPAAAALQVASTFNGVTAQEYPHRAALVMTDALAGHADDLIEQLTVATSAGYEFAGGGAGDDAKFVRTHVFCGTEVLTDAVVALEILSQKPVGIGVDHGWVPASQAFRVTAVEGARIMTLDGFPAAAMFQEHAESSSQRLDRTNPLPFFLHNILGIATARGYKLRMPLQVGADGSVACAGEIPLGATVHIMSRPPAGETGSGKKATQAALRRLGGQAPSAALFFDCVATRLRLGDVFGDEIGDVQRELGDTTLVGCHTYGQIARADGQFSGFHNCTAVVLALPA